MPDKTAQKLTSVEPGGRMPEWELAWANIWVDHLGGTHWSRFTHGTIFESIFEKVYRRPTDSNENSWMLHHVGSVGDAHESDDNPGWQFNQLAVQQLGWVRIKADGLTGLLPGLTVSFDESASEQAIKATIQLLRAHPKTTVVELGACRDFGTEMPMGKAIMELREWLDEAEPADAAAPVYVQKPQSRY